MAAAFGFVAAIIARLASPPPPYGEGSGVEAVRSYAGPDTLKPLRRSPSHPRARQDRKKIVLILPSHGFREYGRPHGHGLRALGLDPARLILVETAHHKDTLWAVDEALRSDAPGAVAAMIDKLDLKLSQRLHLAAQEAGVALFLLRPAVPSPVGREWRGEASAAATRWRIGAAPAARDRFGMFARPRWHLKLERVRNGRPGEWTVEYDHVAHRFSLAAALADPACARGAEEKPRTVAARHRS
jgi:protein ImuA